MESRGAWVEILGVLHDMDFYGICRWNLEELCRCAGVPFRCGKELRDKNVLKGSDGHCEAFIYVPRHGGKDGEPVVLIEENEGPCWYSSRFVRDEYVRQNRGAGSRFQAEPKAEPRGGIGDAKGYGSSSSSSSSSSFHQDHKASDKRFTANQTELTARFHKALGDEWENDRQKWMGRIKNETKKIERVIAEVESAIKESRIKKTPARYAQNIWEEFK